MDIQIVDNMHWRDCVTDKKPTPKSEMVPASSNSVQLAHPPALLISLTWTNFTGMLMSTWVRKFN